MGRKLCVLCMLEELRPQWRRLGSFAQIVRRVATCRFPNGLAASLEEQALQLIENPKEFGMTLEEVVVRLTDQILIGQCRQPRVLTARRWWRCCWRRRRR